MDKLEFDKITEMASKMRRRIIDISMRGTGNSHFGAGLSIVEIMAVLYGKVLRYDIENPEWDKRDRFILSKGHGVLGYYTALEASGYFKPEKLDTFQQNESDLSSHPVMNLKLGIESSNGSLGHGLSFAIGSLLAARRKRNDYKAYVLMGNGECNEGSVWEAAMSASQFKLKNLIAIIDNNNFQSDGSSEHVINMGNIADKWRAFGWNVFEVNGHDIEQLCSALTSELENENPTVIIANTIKGHGISFMENNNEWHHNRLNSEQYEQALQELGGNYDGNK